MRIFIVLSLVFLVAGCTTTQRGAPKSCATYGTPVSAMPRAITVTVDTSVPTAAARPVPAGPAQHIVKPGETLWSISRMYNVDLAALANANSIADPTSIEKGQVLNIPAAQKTAAAGAYRPYRRVMFAWPVRGQVIARFGEVVDNAVNKGIDIRAAQGASITAAKDGRVAYCDSYFKGFGQTVILDHANGYQTVYSYNSDILVKAGDAVRQNDVIARVGQSGRAKEPMLHFEIRCNGEPQDPLQYLSQ